MTERRSDLPSLEIFKTADSFEDIVQFRMVGCYVSESGKMRRDENYRRKNAIVYVYDKLLLKL